MNPVKASTPSHTLFVSVARGTRDSIATATATANRAAITHKRRARAAITIKRQDRHNLDPRIDALQQTAFLSQFLGMEGVLQSIDKRRQAALHHPARVFPLACHGEVLGSAASTGHPGDQQKATQNETAAKHRRHHSNQTRDGARTEARTAETAHSTERKAGPGPAAPALEAQCRSMRP